MRAPAKRFSSRDAPSRLSRDGIAGRDGFRQYRTDMLSTPTQKLVPEGIEGRVVSKGSLADLCISWWAA